MRILTLIGALLALAACATASKPKPPPCEPQTWDLSRWPEQDCEPKEGIK